MFDLNETVAITKRGWVGEDNDCLFFLGIDQLCIATTADHTELPNNGIFELVRLEENSKDNTKIVRNTCTNTKKGEVL